MLRALRLPAVTSLALAATVFGAGAAGAAVSHPRPFTCVKKVTKHVTATGSHSVSVSTRATCTIRGSVDGKHSVVIGQASADAVTSDTNSGSGTARAIVSSIAEVAGGAVSWPG